jgi:hypothetical protein
MSPAVIDVTPLPDYHLRLSFANGEVKRFDMNPFLTTGIFKELTENGMFQTVKVSFDTITWANEADIDPESLYEGSVAEVA